jgi:hypothetical protein
MPSCSKASKRFKSTIQMVDEKLDSRSSPRLSGSRGSGQGASALLQQVPWAVFDRAVVAERADRRHRTSNARSHLAMLLLAQLLPMHGLQDVEAVTAAHAKRWGGARTHLCPLHLRRRQCRPFLGSGPGADPSPAVACGRCDLIRLGFHGRWAEFQNGKIGAKVHVVVDPDQGVPIFFGVSPQRDVDPGVLGHRAPPSISAHPGPAARTTGRGSSR